METISVQRFRELKKIEEERADLMEGMFLLRHARQYLTNNPWDSSGHPGAIELMSSVSGEMENRNKDLAEKCGELWHAILQLDGAELTNPGIEKEGQDVQLAIDWLDRIRWHIGCGDCGLDGQKESLLELADRAIALSDRREELRRNQEEYQWAMAEILAHGSGGYEN